MPEHELTRRGDRWHYVRRVPVNLVPYFGTPIIRKSLKTKNLKEARRRSKRLSAETERVIALAGAGMLSDEELHRLIHKYKRDTLNAFERPRENGYKASDFEALMMQPSGFLDPQTAQGYVLSSNFRTTEEVENIIRLYERNIQALRDSLRLSDLDDHIRMKTQRFVQENGLDVELPAAEFYNPNEDGYFSRPPAEFNRLGRELTKADIEIFLTEIERLKGNYQTEFDRQRQIELSQPKCKTMSEALDIYIKDAETKGRAVKTVMDRRTQRRYFLDMLGDRPLNEITYEELLSFKERLQSSGLGEARAHHYATALNSFFNYSRDRRWIDYSPCPRWEKSAELQKNPGYLPWSVAELQRLLDSSYFTRPLHRIKNPHNFWVPLIGLFSGMRLTEICQLYVEDIKSDDATGLRYFDINKNTPDKRVKHKSYRHVPVHNFLLDIGFMDFFERVKSNGDTRLFQQLPYNEANGYGDDFSDHFGKHTRRNVKMDDPQKRKVFHGLRKNVAANLQDQGVPLETIAHILGHTQAQAMTAFYAGQLGLQQKAEALARLDYGLDLSKLCKLSY